MKTIYDRVSLNSNDSICLCMLNLIKITSNKKNITQITFVVDMIIQY